jgi:hypothetical protein
MISSFFAVCHGLNDKGLHDFEKRMIISKLFFCYGWHFVAKFNNVYLHSNLYIWHAIQS